MKFAILLLCAGAVLGAENLKSLGPKYTSIFIDGSSTRVVGGGAADAGEYPYQASIQVSLGVLPKFHTCGAVIIDENTLLTAAVCFVGIDPRLVTVVAGAQNIKDPNEASQQRHNVASVRAHPAFKLDTVANDIAVITVDAPFVFNDRVNKVNLPTFESVPVGGGQKLTLTGFGVVDGEQELPPVYPDALQELEVTTITNDECRQIYKDVAPYPVNEGQICAFTSLGGACRADSGSAIVSTDEETGERTLVGLVSWGEGCANPRTYPDVYARVGAYLSFIEGW